MIQDELHRIYKSGDKVTVKELNQTLQSLYDKYQIKRKARSTDILLFGFTARRVAISIGTKREEGVLLYHQENTT